MKILHIYKNYYPVLGGIENYIKILAEYQARQGLDVTVLATSLDRRTTMEEINSVKVIKASCLATVSSAPLSLSLFKLTAETAADITHLHFPYPVGECANYFFGRSRHTVITYHSDVVKQKFILPFIKPLLRNVLKKADRIIATSPQYIETSPFLSKVKDKCVVVPLGIDISRFVESDESMSLKIRERFKSDRIALFVGRLRYFKGLNFLIDAMKSVKGILLIVGTGPEGNKLKAQAAEAGLGDRIFFLGDISDEELPSYYKACDVFVLPSSHRSEAFGTVLIEAMASGRAIVSTELGTGTSYVNVHDKTGLVVPSGNSAMLAGAVNRLLSDHSLRQEFAANAKKRAEEFSDIVLNRRILQVYREVMLS